MGGFKKNFKSITATVLTVISIGTIGYQAGSYLTEIDCGLKLNQNVLESNEKLLQEINKCKELNDQKQQVSADELRDIVEFIKTNRHGLQKGN